MTESVSSINPVYYTERPVPCLKKVIRSKFGLVSCECYEVSSISLLSMRIKTFEALLPVSDLGEVIPPPKMERLWEDQVLRTCLGPAVQHCECAACCAGCSACPAKWPPGSSSFPFPPQPPFPSVTNGEVKLSAEQRSSNGNKWILPSNKYL